MESCITALGKLYKRDYFKLRVFDVVDTLTLRCPPKSLRNAIAILLGS